MKCPTEKKIYPLHCHTVYSLLDGVSTVDEYLKYCKEQGMEACSCTDHGYVMGLYDLVTKSEKAGIKGIPGLEAYLYPGDDYVIASDQKKKPNYFHLTLWAMNQRGYQTLLELSNCSWQEGRVINIFGLKPRMTWEDLQENNEGIICGSGCIMGPIVCPYLRGEKDMANLNANRLLDIFGPDRLFMEVMPHRVDKDWKTKDIIQVDSLTGMTYTFDKNDVIETDQGKMTVAEAMKRRVKEITAAVTKRPQKHAFTEREITL